VEMMSLVTKLLGPPEEVATCSRFPGHGHRWMIFENQNLKVYLHHSANDSFSDDLGAYPKRFISIGLAKSYTGESAHISEVCAERVAWMVLIAKSAHIPENIPRA